MSEDTLEQHGELIARANGGYIGLDYISEGRVADCIAALAAALRAERERVAELETDAKLGRMVREMPEGAWFSHKDTVTTFGRASYTYSEPRPDWGNYSRCMQSGDVLTEVIQIVRNRP